MEETNDQDTEDIKDETSDVQSTEAAEITPERAIELAQKAEEIARGTQKGYTITRQELAEIRENQAAIQSALEELRSQKSNELDEFGEEKPLTKKELMATLAEIEQQKANQQANKEAMVDSMVEDMIAEGLVKDNNEADDLIKFALDAAKSAKLKEISPDYVLSLYPAWQKVKEVEGIKTQLKTKTRGEEGSKVGTSEKTQIGEQGVSYKSVHSKGWDEI